jgi:hypothetical protein
MPRLVLDPLDDAHADPGEPRGLEDACAFGELIADRLDPPAVYGWPTDRGGTAAAFLEDRVTAESLFCLWCGKGFTPRRDGGKPQVFCRPVCRRRFDAAGRRWVADAIATGALTVDALRNGAAATRALLAGGAPPVPISEPQKPAPVAPAERPDGPRRSAR